ncbi:MAG: 50S ribosomal protein L30 [Nanoarchaeota archaeon]
MDKIAVIRIRGTMNVNKEIKDTLNMLRLFNKHYCVILESTPVYVGMLKKIKDYVTWGEINKETFLALLKERGRLPGNKRLTEDYLKDKNKLNFEEFANEFLNNKKSLKDIPGLKLFFKLKPPVKGFERGGIKNPFSLGGVLGYRKDKINDLLIRMI